MKGTKGKEDQFQQKPPIILLVQSKALW